MRYLNPLECLEWGLGNQQPFNIVMEIIGEGTIDCDRLRRSVELLHNNTPVLQQGVLIKDQKLCFYPLENPQLPFLCCKEISTYSEINQKFASGAPLYRITLVQSENSFRIYLTLHHVIGDGICGAALARSLLMFYTAHASLPSQNNGSDWFSTLPIEEPFKNQPPQFAAVETTTKPFQGKTGLYSVTLSTEKSSAFLAKCKQHAAMVQGALTAGMLQAFESCALGQIFPQTMLSHHLVDMRPLLTPPMPNAVLACVISQLIIPLDRTEKREFWEMARNFSEKIKLGLRNGDPFKTLEEVGKLLFVKGLMDHLSSKESTLCITNVGKIAPIATTDFKVINIKTYVTMHGIYQSPSLLLAVNSYAGQLNFQWHYPDFFLKEEQVKECAERFIEHLYKAIEIKKSF